jgi:predicted Rossmann fold nucleotide-binding protein DprA/Smf involved in DNA uptake
MTPLTWHIGGQPADPRSFGRMMRKPRMFLGSTLLAHLRAGPKTADELAEITGRHPWAAWASLRSMEGQGRVVRDGTTWRPA